MEEMYLRDKYLLEKHFLRKRIRTLRKQVLLRKFAYLFFRKSISNVLPSTAQSHYLNCIKKKAFQKLKNNWYKERIQWKYYLRAKLHHNFVLKNRYFKKLALFYVRKKTKRVKATIAQVMFDRNFEKQILSFFFAKWIKYVKYRKNENLKNTIADQHFKSKWRLELLKTYFFKWRVFTIKGKLIKSKIEGASRFFDNKLLCRVFNAFLLYNQCRKLNRKQMESAILIFSRKLKRKTFSKLMFYRTYKLRQKEKNEFVHFFYERKLLKHCMVILWKNVERKKFKRERLTTFVERKLVRMKKTTLDTWKYYVLNKKQYIEKFTRAKNLHDFHNKSRCFQKLKMYCINKKEKRNYQKLKGDKIASMFEKIILSNFFDSWRCFVSIKIKKKKKMELVLAHIELKLKKNCFHTWINFKDYKIIKRNKMMALDIHFNYNLLRNFFHKWKLFIKERRLYKTKLSEAKKYYRHNLIRENFRLIIKTAVRIKHENLANHLENEKKRLMLAQKYLRIWKMKSKYCKLRMRPRVATHNIEEKVLDIDITPEYEKLALKPEQKESSLFFPHSEGFSDAFQWDPMCFAKPRVPDYMKNC